jgi:hypothetical protein
MGHKHKKEIIAYRWTTFKEEKSTCRRNLSTQEFANPKQSVVLFVDSQIVVWEK